jgi:deoxyribodipyrimidine photolyase-related protein
MTSLRVILGDQLSEDISSLRDITPGDSILMAEVMTEASYVPHHKKKLIFIFSAMRHFADTLRQRNIQVYYTQLDDPENSNSILGEITRHLDRAKAEQVIVTKAGEYRLTKEMKTWSNHLGLPVECREDDRFLASQDDFSHWAEGRKSLRMEYFYREMRRRYDVLMENGKPVGGEWNYDSENRAPPKEGLTPPQPFSVAPDAITTKVMAMVTQRFPNNMGEADDFLYAATRTDALAALKQFLDERLPLFGTYQDAMIDDEPWMYHAHIGLYLNSGLLSPREVISKAQERWQNGEAPLNAVEGFIRQILGWREYVRGIYWYRMPEYAQKNALTAHRPLPDFFWTADTKMRCLHISIQNTIDHAYAHHIQRLMVIGNFSLLAGLDPAAVNEWYLAVYADAYEWVELPNVHGMTLYADGGDLASKPYAASGAYINRMSNYCKGCHYSVKSKSGADACPFNLLYWDFLMRNEDKLAGNPRMGMPYRNLARMDAARKDQISEDTAKWFRSI